MANKKSSTVSKRMQRRAEKRRKQRQIQLIVGVVLIVILGIVGWAVFGTKDAPADVAQNALPAEITVDEGYQKYQDGVFLLDVRTQEEWDDYHIPNTTLIPLDQLESRIDELPRGEEIVVVCRSGNRSQVGRDTLLAAGFEQVTSMSGGVSTWQSAGYPTE